MSTIVVRANRSWVASALPPILFFVGPLITSMVPRLTPLVLALLGLALIVAALCRGANWRVLIEPNPALAACLAFAAYVFVNALWAADLGNALGKAGTLLGVIVMAFAASSAVTHLDEKQLRRAALGFVAGAGLGALYLLFELLTGGAITRAAMNFITVLKPDSAKHLDIAKGKVTKLSLAEFNQNAAVLMLHFWPGLLVLGMLAGVARRVALIALFFLALAVPIAISLHESSQVALVGSLLVLLLAWKWRGPVIKGLAVFWCLCFVLVIPLDFLAYKAGLHLAPWLPSSARARVIIWEYTAELTLEHPWLGVGVGSTAALRDQQKRLSPAEQPEGFVFHRSTGQHAHDVFLQSWYELGVVGAILLALAGVLVVLRIGVLPFVVQPFAAASFAAFACIAAFAWGMWQSWFMCAVGLVPLYLRMTAAAVDGSLTESQSTGSLPSDRRQPIATQ